ncbi:D-ribose-binding periplasmic protein precursor [Planctomycetes bacterium Poly30]|uniref:D-ribose-binding periplasmic protein n=1 Tax=Saltatorellus ferox TaxID=2528018 RepID=A0A518EKK8_9BACT|nr:D-ribose-binding periplasmic protein precursor [Planctomycetes bacterium Poly30]
MSTSTPARALRKASTLLTLPLLATLPVLLGACGNESEAGAEKALQIAVIPKGTTHEYWKAVHAGAEGAAQELGVQVVWKGPIKEDDRAAQVQVVEDFVVRGVDGIVLMPLDKVALAPPAAEAHGRGIPVVIADSDLDWKDRVSFVATDNHHGGELAGEALAEMLGGDGRVILLRYLEGSASTAEREQGFLDAIAKHDGIEVISANQYAGASTESAYKASEDLLQSFPSFDGIFCPNESAAFGMLRALQDSGRTKTAKFIGFDASEKLVAALREGEVDALVLQDPVRMGDLAVRACVDRIRGKAVEPRIDTGVVVVKSSEIDKPEVQALLSPDLSILNR